MSCSSALTRNIQPIQVILVELRILTSSRKDSSNMMPIYIHPAQAPVRCLDEQHREKRRSGRRKDGEGGCAHFTLRPSSGRDAAKPALQSVVLPSPPPFSPPACCFQQRSSFSSLHRKYSLLGQQSGSTTRTITMFWNTILLRLTQLRFSTSLGSLGWRLSSRQES